MCTSGYIPMNTVYNMQVSERWDCVVNFLHVSLFDILHRHVILLNLYMISLYFTDPFLTVLIICKVNGNNWMGSQSEYMTV